MKALLETRLLASLSISAVVSHRFLEGEKVKSVVSSVQACPCLLILCCPRGSA